MRAAALLAARRGVDDGARAGDVDGAGIADVARRGREQWVCVDARRLMSSAIWDVAIFLIFFVFDSASALSCS